MDKTDQSNIPTSLRTLRILEALAESDEAMTPTEINTKLGLPKQTAHRLCARLVAEGYIAYVPGGKKLRPARRLREMSVGLLSASQVHVVRRRVLEDVAGKVGETVNFVAASEEGMSYLDRVETDWALRVQLPIGTHVPFHCTASGKTYLASLRPAVRAKMVDAMNLERLSSNTITSPEDMLDELKRVAREGHAIDNEEFMDGMVAIAVPVKDAAGRFIAALAFHGPTQRLNRERLLAHKKTLVEAAKHLADILTLE